MGVRHFHSKSWSSMTNKQKFMRFSLRVRWDTLKTYFQKRKQKFFFFIFFFSLKWFLSFPVGQDNSWSDRKTPVTFFFKELLTPLNARPRKLLLRLSLTWTYQKEHFHHFFFEFEKKSLSGSIPVGRTTPGVTGIFFWIEFFFLSSQGKWFYFFKINKPRAF